MADTILNVDGLSVAFGDKQILKDVSFSLPRAGVLGIVGESGSGKSVTALALMRLLADRGRVMAGSILLEGEDVLTKSPREMQALRGGRMAMIFQEPMTSLNPLFTVGNQIAEAVVIHKQVSWAVAYRRAGQLLERVGIADPGRRLSEFPHQMSGGMRQRIMIAMALAAEPALLIADEPTTALDVTIQAQILDLLRDLQRDFGMAILLITHDLGVVAEFATDVAVMYAGSIIEAGTTSHVFRSPGHPYTRALLEAVPHIGPRQHLPTPIYGLIPMPGAWPDGCRFSPRCSLAFKRCRTEEPGPTASLTGHSVSCHLADGSRNA